MHAVHCIVHNGKRCSLVVQLMFETVHGKGFESRALNETLTLSVTEMLTGNFAPCIKSVLWGIKAMSHCRK